MNPITSEPLDRGLFPLDDWGLVESRFEPELQGRMESLFTVGNGYLGMRGNLDEGRDGVTYGTFINGFHETWPIRHPEEAFGFARVGQTIVNVVDAKVIRLYVDDQPFVLSEVEVLHHTRRLDFRDGVLIREAVWRTPTGKVITVRTRRMIPLTERHLAVVEYEVESDADASLLISSQLVNRQDGVDEEGTARSLDDESFDPRKAETLENRVLQPKLKVRDGGRILLGYRTTNSELGLVCGVDHRIETENDWDEAHQLEDDIAKQIYRVRAKAGQPVRIVKTVAYHTSDDVSIRELRDRCNRTLDRIGRLRLDELYEAQHAWLEEFWRCSDVEIEGQPGIQQAVRWNLFQVAQATARTDGEGIAAKGVSGDGYGGHYFWDAEIYVLPFLTYTLPQVARNALRFRQKMLEPARHRAAELNQRGALFPWRTINGLESSAYYAAGTAQYHIDADITYALMQYVRATGDLDFLARGAIDILVETARLWADLGFWRSNGSPRFHIHGVTGPDEYTTVVNDNLYTNVMARANLRAAAQAVSALEDRDPEAYDRMRQRLDLDPDELVDWVAAADAMHIPYDERLGIHPQDAQFLDKELWDLENTPDLKRPLLMHYHPLVIYRFQVLKQADVVLASFLHGQDFTQQQKRNNFEYYDALTTGDSSLSAVVQSIIAAEVGYQTLASHYFLSALYVDLADLHGNTADGIHVASTGGVWSALAMGFGGMRDHGGDITFDPRLPADWRSLTFRVTLHGTRVRVRLTADTIRFEVEHGDKAELAVRGEYVEVTAGNPVSVALDDQGPVLHGTPSTRDLLGGRRADGSVITASIPTISNGDRNEAD
ncbi:glycoside hydrolase family 65 protein [Herbiconiux sp. SYSU D00978]|uniref:glycoside hydrolase family 65 protein n=1 Tax=Herbiconiux sp. SYSU D00978 TaxID=2812562 RepID=UPI001A967C05|nr:glycoside hydrolase family 65 protein [Herbiconiux sp. SYSU D00978]